MFVDVVVADVVHDVTIRKAPHCATLHWSVPRSVVVVAAAVASVCRTWCDGVRNVRCMRRGNWF